MKSSLYFFGRRSFQPQINLLASAAVNEPISCQFTARQPAALSIWCAPCPFLSGPQSPVSAHGGETTRCHARTRSAARWKPRISSVSPQSDRPACQPRPHSQHYTPSARLLCNTRRSLFAQTQSKSYSEGQQVTKEKGSFNCSTW